MVNLIVNNNSKIRYKILINNKIIKQNKNYQFQSNINISIEQRIFSLSPFWYIALPFLGLFSLLAYDKPKSPQLETRETLSKQKKATFDISGSEENIVLDISEFNSFKLNGVKLVDVKYVVELNNKAYTRLTNFGKTATIYGFVLLILGVICLAFIL